VSSYLLRFIYLFPVLFCSKNAVVSSFMHVCTHLTVYLEVKASSPTMLTHLLLASGCILSLRVNVHRVFHMDVILPCIKSCILLY
jgi:hypothetical protein